MKGIQVDNVHLILPALVLGASVVFVLVIRAVLFSELSRRIPGISRHLLAVYPLLEGAYLRNRPKIGSKGMDALALASLLSPLLLVASVIWLSGASAGR